jgi:membrane protein YdbS with pleckstrin-like domain
MENISSQPQQEKIVSKITFILVVIAMIANAVMHGIFVYETLDYEWSKRAFVICFFVIIVPPVVLLATSKVNRWEKDRYVWALSSILITDAAALLAHLS